MPEMHFSHRGEKVIGYPVQGKHKPFIGILVEGIYARGDSKFPERWIVAGEDGTQVECLLVGSIEGAVYCPSCKRVSPEGKRIEHSASCKKPRRARVD